jgi:transcription antitermination factor NusG
MDSRMTDRAWYVVYSKAHKEEAAQFHLRQKGFEVFFPRLLLPPLLRVRKQVIPLFPNYLFVQARLPEEYECVSWTSGVKRFVCFNDMPVPIDKQIVTYLMHAANPQGVIMARCALNAGQQVRITCGPLEGLVGIIQEPPNSRGRVKILMHLLSRRIQMDAPLEFLEAMGIACRPLANINYGAQSQG